MRKNCKQVVVEHPFVVWATEDERANTDQSNRQPHEDFQLDEEPEFAEGQLSPGEQGRNQEQVHDRRTHVGRDRFEGVRQSRQNGGRLDQCLEAVHPAQDSPPYEDAQRPCANGSLRSHRRSLQWTKRSFPGRYPSPGRGAFPELHLSRSYYPSKGSVSFPGSCPAWEEGGHGQGVRERPCHAATRSCSLNSPSAQNCNWREQAITLKTP